MQKLSLSLLVLALTGCTTTTTNTADGPEVPFLTAFQANTINPNLGDTTALQPSDIKAINETIAADRRKASGLQDEVQQQYMAQDI